MSTMEISTFCCAREALQRADRGSRALSQAAAARCKLAALCRCCCDSVTGTPAAGNWLDCGAGAERIDNRLPSTPFSMVKPCCQRDRPRSLTGSILRGLTSRAARQLCTSIHVLTDKQNIRALTVGTLNSTERLFSARRPRVAHQLHNYGCGSEAGAHQHGERAIFLRASSIESASEESCRRQDSRSLQLGRCQVDWLVLYLQRPSVYVRMQHGRCSGYL